MPTRTGWTLLGGSIALGLAGRVVAITELTVIAASGLVLWAVAAAATLGRRPAIEVDRRLTPATVPSGTPAEVVLTVHAGRRATPPLLLHDAVSGTSGATLGLAPLRSRGVARVSYTVPTSHRGEISIGPLVAGRTDPFSLWRTQVQVPGTASLLVLPVIEDLRSTTPGHGDRAPLTRARGASGPGSAEADVARLRPYVPGDDLRRVHWRSTARRGEMLTRLDDPPDDGRVRVILDTDPDHLGPQAFEVAVSAAASLAIAVLRRGERVEVLTTSGTTSGPVAGAPGADVVGAMLARVDQRLTAPSGAAWDRSGAPHDRLPRIVITGTGSRSGHGFALPVRSHDDTVVAIAPRLGDPDAPSLAHTATDDAPIGDAPDHLVIVGADQAFAAAWDARP